MAVGNASLQRKEKVAFFNMSRIELKGTDRNIRISLCFKDQS